MLNNILLILIGAFIGWNLPQPGWAKWIQSRVYTTFNRFMNKWNKK